MTNIFVSEFLYRGNADGTGNWSVTLATEIDDGFGGTRTEFRGPMSPAQAEALGVTLSSAVEGINTVALTAATAALAAKTQSDTDYQNQIKNLNEQIAGLTADKQNLANQLTATVPVLNPQLYGTPTTDVQSDKVVITYPVALGAEDQANATNLNNRLAASDIEYDRLINIGYWHNFGTADVPIWETLQLRNADDKTNWLGLARVADKMVAAGAGAYPISPPFTTTSNRQYTPSAADSEAILDGLLIWAGTMLFAHTNIKSALRAASDTVSRNAIDITAGYPADPRV